MPLCVLCRGEFRLLPEQAKTTVGISTFALDGLSSPPRWEASALRFFAAGTPGEHEGRNRTSFVERGRLPNGPGGPVYFDVSYVNDKAEDGSARSAEVVRGRTGAVSCSAAPLCDQQCAGAAQYAKWRSGCPPL